MTMIKQTQRFKDNLFPTGLARIVMIGAAMLMIIGLLAACAPAAPAPEEVVAVLVEPQAGYAGKKILWVDSYHAEYDWSKGIETGLRSALADTGVELKIVRMDTKRNTDDEFRINAALKAKEEIEVFDPDVVIVADDNAQKYLVVPHLMNTDLPVIFCGVNWDASEYGYPASNVTGMIEVELPSELVEHLQLYAQGDRVGYLTVDSDTERKIAGIYNERFFDGTMETYYVKTLDEFKETFLKAQQEMDMLFVGNNAGIDVWNEAEIEAYVSENTVIPTGTINDWMAPYALVTLAKSAEEQGEWSAQAALRILDGIPISQIPIAENKEGKLILNFDIAEQLDVVFSPSMLRNAEIYGSPEGTG